MKDMIEKIISCPSFMDTFRISHGEKSATFLVKKYENAYVMIFDSLHSYTLSKCDMSEEMIEVLDDICDMPSKY